VVLLYAPQPGTTSAQNYRPPPDPPSLLGLTAQPRADPLASLARELELELIQPHMAQKPVLRGEVGCVCAAREVGVERGGMGERGCAVGMPAVHVCEGPARRRATCGVLVNIMPVNSWPGVANWRGPAEPSGAHSSTKG